MDRFGIAKQHLSDALETMRTKLLACREDCEESPKALILLAMRELFLTPQEGPEKLGRPSELNNWTSCCRLVAVVFFKPFCWTNI